jgi:hypothetical protein
MSLETRIALIGVVGALTGTLVGGLVTYAITQEQISSQTSESHRQQRLDAYAAFFGDATKLWSQVFASVRVDPQPKSLDAATRGTLSAVQEELIAEFARLALLAPPRVRNVGQKLNNVDTDVWNALNARRIDYETYNRAASQIIPAHGQGLLKQFADAMRQDLRTQGG